KERDGGKYLRTQDAVRVSIPGIAECSGESESTVGRNLTQAAKLGLITKHLDRVRQPDGTTITLMSITPPAETHLEALRWIEAREVPKSTRGHGGPRTPQVKGCHVHPAAAVIWDQTWCCSECGVILDQHEERVAPAGTSTQDDVWSPEGPRVDICTLGRQDDVWLDGDPDLDQQSDPLIVQACRLWPDS